MDIDNREFYNCVNKNNLTSINDLKNQIDNILIDLSKCWFLKNGKNGKNKYSFNSFVEKFKIALKQCTMDQFIVIGTSTNDLYSLTSRSIHFTPRFLNHKIDEDYVTANISHCALLTHKILLLIKDILNLNTTHLTDLKKITDLNKYPERLAQSEISPNFEVGDYVIAYNDLARITKVNISKYGFKSFEIKYLGQQPLPGIDKDEYLARYIKRLGINKASLIAKMNIITGEDVTKDPEFLEKLLDKSLVHAWENGGLKEHMYGNESLAQIKLNKEQKILQNQVVDVLRNRLIFVLKLIFIKQVKTLKLDK